MLQSALAECVKAALYIATNDIPPQHENVDRKFTVVFEPGKSKTLNAVQQLVITSSIRTDNASEPNTYCSTLLVTSTSIFLVGGVNDSDKSDAISFLKTINRDFPNTFATNSWLKSLLLHFKIAVQQHNPHPPL